MASSSRSRAHYYLRTGQRESYCAYSHSWHHSSHYSYSNSAPNYSRPTYCGAKATAHSPPWPRGRWSSSGQCPPWYTPDCPRPGSRPASPPSSLWSRWPRCSHKWASSRPSTSQPRTVSCWWRSGPSCCRSSCYCCGCCRRQRMRWRPEMGNCYLKKKSITNYITNNFYTKKLALSVEVIGLTKANCPVTNY